VIKNEFKRTRYFENRVFMLYWRQEITHLDDHKFVSCSQLRSSGCHGRVILFEIQDCLCITMRVSYLAFI